MCTLYMLMLIFIMQCYLCQFSERFRPSTNLVQLLDFNHTCEKLQVGLGINSVDQQDHSDTIIVKTSVSVLRQVFLVCYFFSHLDRVIQVSIVERVSEKTRTLIRSIKFLSSQVALYPYITTVWPVMKYCSRAICMPYELLIQLCRGTGSILSGYTAK